MAEFANITSKINAIPRFLGKILPVPISSKEPISSKLRGRLRFLLQITVSASLMTSYLNIQMCFF